MVTFEDRLDEESKAVLEMIPESLLDLSDIPAARAAIEGLMAAMFASAPEIPGVETEDHWVPGAPGDPDVMVRVYTPSGIEGPVPALYWIHGGGMVLGDVPMDDLNCKGVALEMGCVVASVEYRLAPEHPHPAPIEDCYAGLKWLAENADSLGVDSSRIAIGGASAGGGLAAALALLARDRAEVQVIFQQLVYPMLDDRNITPASHYVQHPKVWNRKANIAGWSALLGKPAGSDGVSPYASPARAEDLSGLPPAFIIVGELDLFVDEDIEYAQRLIQAGVPVELHVFPGAFHGSDLMVPTCENSQRWATIRTAALRQALHGSA
ncbi:MAG: alpha/beta hydrolase [Acidimicrobiia bacterium]|nr:alpha/beta hydrolase [Acidimicrobiia bacterium]